MAGTRISYVSGKRRAVSGSHSMGSIDQYYPDDLTADSEPNIDNLIPFNSYWSPRAYIDWFADNISVYGLTVAQYKMLDAMQQWSSIGAEITYCMNPTWTKYFADNGVHISSTYCTVLNDAGQIVDSAGNVITNTLKATDTLSKLIVPVIGLAIIGIGWYGYNTYIKK